MQIINLVDCKKYYKGLSHQKGAVEYLGSLLLKTPAKNRLHLYDPYDWIELSDKELNWLQDQISNPTLQRFALLWRAEDVATKVEDQVKYFSQRDNKINWAISCNSSSHSMYTDFVLRKHGKPGLQTDDEFVKRVYSGSYGRYGRNNSASWDIVHRVCASFGVYCKYSNKGQEYLIREIKKTGISCVNIFHKGSTKNTRAGGHVVAVIDFDVKKGYLIYDPWGSKPSTNYSNKSNGIYWMPKSEFNWRFQGIHTELLRVK